ncbi:MAG: hypothetical protein IJ153_05695 [Clostridia bacterium]|nr:hypothetical protein [Clostridia bacterium]MBQ9211178.1 hypothetical protein [Clostridia bacterium]
MRGVDERTGSVGSAIKYTLGSLEADIRCAIPGIIQSYDPDKGTCTVQCAIREKVSVNGSEQEMSIPVLPDVPIVMPRTKDYMLCLYPQKDDECLVIFSDLCIDGWWQSGGEQSQMDNRRHDLSDGFAILAPWSQTRKPDSPLKEEGIRVQNVKNKAYFWIKKNNVIVCSATGGISNYGQVIIQGKNENVYIKFEDEDIQIKCKNLKIETVEKIDIQALQDITISSLLSIKIEALTTLDLKSTAAMTLDATGPLTMKSAAATTVAGSTIDLNGTLRINGSPYLSHTHTAPDGGGTTSGVN